MAPFRKFCTITSRVKGDHIYSTKPKNNTKCVCYLEPVNSHSSHAIVVKTKATASNSPGPDSDVTVGHVPDALANVFYQAFELGYIKMTCIITGQSRAAPEGVWVQGGGIEIPCLYDVDIQEEVSQDLRKCLKEKLKSLRETRMETSEQRPQT